MFLQILFSCLLFWKMFYRCSTMLRRIIPTFWAEDYFWADWNNQYCSEINEIPWGITFQIDLFHLCHAFSTGSRCLFSHQEVAGLGGITCNKIYHFIHFKLYILFFLPKKVIYCVLLNSFAMPESSSYDEPFELFSIMNIRKLVNKIQCSVYTFFCYEQMSCLFVT